MSGAAKAPKVLIDALTEASHAMTAAAFELARWAPNDVFNARALQLSAAAILIRDDWMPAIIEEDTP